MMRFVMAYAGIPDDFYDMLYARKDRFAREITFHGVRMNAKTPVYTDQYNQRLIDYFSSLIADDHHNNLGETAFAVIAVHHDEQTTQALADALFPSIYLATVNWTADRSTTTRQKASANSLGEAFGRATEKAKSSLRLIGDEIVARSNQTPFLLPLENFASGHLAPEMRSVHRELSHAPDSERRIGEALNRIKCEHPFNRPEGREKRAYVDDRDIIFDSPGQARHGYARPGGDHPPTCLLTSKRRLGAPYDHAFHYDCTHARRAKLRGRFVNCHAVHGQYKGDPHLNIAPNDFVRE